MFTAQNGPIGYQDIDETNTTKRHPLGKIVKAYDPTYGEGEFIYLLGLATTAIGSVVTYNADDFSTTLLIADAIGPVAVAMSANVASQYGWYQIGGKAVAKTDAAVADNASLFSTTTAGSIDDAAVAGDRVQRSKAASAVTEAGTIHVELERPFVDNGLGATT